MQDILILSLIWLASLAALIGGVILYRRRGHSSAAPTSKDSAQAESENAIPPHRLDRIKRGDQVDLK